MVTPEAAYALYIDIGSTRHKEDIVERNSLEPFFPQISRDMSQNVTIDTIDNMNIKWMDGDQFLRNATDMMATLLLQNDSPDIDLVASTGFTNNLVVSYTDKEGHLRRKIILDDPSVETDLLPEQYSQLSHFIPNFSGLKVSTSLMKILALKNHPELINYLFPMDASFEDLHFSSVLGLLNEVISGGEVRGIPPGDLKGFAGTPGKTIEEVRNLLTDLGIGQGQLEFSDNNEAVIYIPQDGASSKEVRLFQITDFEANTFAIRELIEQGVIDKGSIMMELDTVGKVFWLPHKSILPKDARKMNEFVYLIQRLTAGVNSSILKRLVSPLLEIDSQTSYNQMIEVLLKEGLEEKGNPFLYYPEASQENPFGRLFLDTGGELHEINLDPTAIRLMVSSLKDENIRYHIIGQIVRGVIRGVFFGLRQKSEKAMLYEGKTTEETDIVVYGGLVHKHPHLKHYHEPWRLFIKQCFYPHNVYHVDLANAGLAAVYMGNRIAYGKDNSQNIFLRREQIQDTLDRSDEYEKWKFVSDKVFSS